MTSFGEAVAAQVNKARSARSARTTTTNGMKARVSSTNACVDFFFKIAAMRGQSESSIIKVFSKAYAENPEVALRIMLWLRDIRGGAGERHTFRILLKHVESNVGLTYSYEELYAILNKVPTVGRWDDLFYSKFDDKNIQEKTYILDMIKAGLEAGNGLLAKWLPREKSANKQFALAVMNHLGLTSRQYRKLLVGLTKVVESQMTAKDWDNIDFGKVPSKATQIYKHAFKRNTADSGAYEKYVQGLVDGTEKVNASAIFPHEILKDVYNRNGYALTSTMSQLIQAQWDAQPDYLDGQNILPMVDVSGSMFWESAKIKGTKDLYAGHVAIALGLYVADKAKGALRGHVLNFAEKTNISKIDTSNIITAYREIMSLDWGGSTNIEGAFAKVLKTGLQYGVPDSEMPRIILIMSDMQFDQCSRDPSASAIKMIRMQYEAAGYTMPKVVFWNLAAYDNVPVKFNKSGTAMVSGYSPSLMKSILNGGYEDFTPENVMLETVMIERYDLGNLEADVSEMII